MSQVAARRIPLFVAILAFLTGGFLGAAHAQHADEASHVYFLLAIDTITPGTHELGLDLDRDHMLQTIHDAMKQVGYKEGAGGRYSVRVLQGREMTERNVLDYFRTLRATERDTLVFYYTGHGGFVPDKGHLLSLYNQGQKRANVDRKELLAAMARHNPRAVIVLTDCCASSNVPIIAGGYKASAPDPSKKPVLQGQGKGEVFRDLFFQSKGIVNVTAARTGSAAFGQRDKGGSFFTLAMIGLLKEEPEFFHKRGGPVTWRDFYPHLSTLTEFESLSIDTSKKGQKTARFHTPEAFMLGAPARTAKGPGGKIENVLLTIDEHLTDQDPTFKKGRVNFRLKQYPVNMLKGKAYLISLHSSQFDTYLYLKDENGNVLAENDDYGTTTTRSRILYYPQADGKFVVGVTSFNGGETGEFSLTVQQSTLHDRLTGKDPLDRYCLGARAKVHAVQLTAFRTYTIQLESEDTNQFDPFLRIEDEFGNTIAMNDDEDTDQERYNSMISFRTLHGGTYYIVATSYLANQTGRYAVFIQR